MNARKNIGTLLTAAALVLTATGCAPRPADLAEGEIERLLGDDARTVAVTIDGTGATLRGAVRDRSTKTLSAEIVLAQPGIESVDNQLTLPERQPLERMYMESVDDGMLFRVDALLLRKVGPAAVKDLAIYAVDGVVSLRGPVPSDDVRRSIVETASGVEDVRKVIDLMRTVASEGNNPSEAPSTPPAPATAE
ncbi:MAG: BON domain-containing protein [Thermoanaerobaculia bacterium]